MDPLMEPPATGLCANRGASHAPGASGVACSMHFSEQTSSERAATRSTITPNSAIVMLLV